MVGVRVRFRVGLMCIPLLDQRLNLGCLTSATTTQPPQSNNAPTNCYLQSGIQVIIRTTLDGAFQNLCLYTLL